MAKFPALPLFTDAYLADTRHLSTLQHGAYLLMLMTAWRSEDCALPCDDTYLARITGLDRRTWQANKDALLAFWRMKNGKLVQARLGDERKYVEDKRNKNAASGRASALKRKERHSTNVQPEVNETSTPTPTPTPIKDISVAKATSPPQGQYSDAFEDFWRSYPKNGASKKTAYESYTRAIKEGATHETIVTAIGAYHDYLKRTDTPTAHATTWLNQQRWTVDYDNLHDRAARPRGQHQADSPHDRMGRAWAKAAGIHPGEQGD